MDQALYRNTTPSESMNPNGAKFSTKLQEWLKQKSGEVPLLEAQQVLETEQFLMPDEKVTFALRLWRNTLVLTEERLIKFVRGGIFGRIWQYTSMPYSTIIGFQTRSAGNIRIGGEIRAWTSTPASSTHVWRISLLNGMYKQLAAAKELAVRCLETEANRAPPASLLQRPKPFAWLFGHWGDTDAEKLETRIRNDAPLLDDETIFAAFKIGRDSLIFTSLRLLQMDVKWFSGKSIEYRSLPYSSVKMWQVDFGDIWHTLTIWTILHPKNFGAVSRITARFQADSVELEKIDNFLRDILFNANRVEPIS